MVIRVRPCMTRVYPPSYPRVGTRDHRRVTRLPLLMPAYCIIQPLRFRLPACLPALLACLPTQLPGIQQNQAIRKSQKQTRNEKAANAMDSTTKCDDVRPAELLTHVCRTSTDPKKWFTRNSGWTYSCLPLNHYTQKSSETQKKKHETNGFE